MRPAGVTGLCAGACRSAGLGLFAPLRLGLGLGLGLIAAPAWAGPPAAASPPAAVDLGSPAAAVAARLGPPLRVWRVALCPGHQIELRRQGQRLLKTVHGPDDRLAAVGIHVLRPPGKGDGRPLPLRWPGLRPGLAAVRPYAQLGDLRPWFHTAGAKQMLWFERDTTAAPGVHRYLGSATVDGLSDFAFGRGFRSDLAADLASASSRGLPYEVSDATRPLLDWRQRAVPNALVETRAVGSEDTACDLFRLARIDAAEPRPR